MSDNSGDTPRPLYGVFFHYDGRIDEREVRKEFYSYGCVHSVKQILSRVYVNFLSQDAAEKCLLGRHAKYGEVSKGRFGPKEQKDCDNNSDSSKGSRKKCAPKNKSSNSFSLEDKDDFGENCKTNTSRSSSSSRNVEHSMKKNSPRQLKSKQNILKKSLSKGENYLSAKVYDTLRSSPSQLCVIHSSNYEKSRSPPYDEDSQDDEPPELLSIHHHPHSSTNKYEDSEGPPPLVSTSANAAVSPSSLPRVSASSRRSQANEPPELLSIHHHPRFFPNKYEDSEGSEGPPPLVSTSASTAVSPNSLSRVSVSSRRSQGDKPPELLSIHHHPRSFINKYEDSEDLPPLVSTTANAAVSPNSLSRVSASSRRLVTKDIHTHKFQNGITDNVRDDIPQLIPTEAHLNGFQVCNDETREPFSSYYKQVLIANVPNDITQNEVEKILYPLEPIYVSDLDVTNIRLKIGFVQVLFAHEEEANRAARQFDGLTLRGHYLSVKKVIDLVSMK